jgi:hypothetical protein
VRWQLDAKLGYTRLLAGRVGSGASESEAG